MGTRRAKHSKRATRKAGSGGLSVATLHASFEKMDNKVRAAIGRGISDAELASCIRSQWSSLFHGTMSPAAVRGMVMHYRALYGKGPRRTHKRQRGGMAPMAWTLGQGISDAMYGRFPVDMGATPRVVASLDRFYENPVSRACDSTGGHDAPVGLTSGQTGGGLLDGILAGHGPMSVPRNIIEQSISAVQGAPIQDPPADPTTPTWQLQHPPSAVFDPKPISNLAGLAPIYTPV